MIISKENFLKNYNHKVINAVVLSILTYEHDMSKNEKENIKIKPKHLFHDINLISMLSFLGANNRLPLFHMTKSLVYIQEIDQHINQFSIGYMINPRLNTNGIFKDQVNICMKKTFNVTEQKHITKILTQENTRVLALLWYVVL